MKVNGGWVLGVLVAGWAALGGGAGTAWAQGGGEPELIYDNTTHVTTLFYRFGREYGDEIEVAGTARRVTRFTFRYFGDIPAGYQDGSYRIRFYANDGHHTLPDRLTGQMPGTVLWESESRPILPGFQTPLINVPGVDVPDRFTWTVQFTGVSGAVGQSAGLVLADPPSVGRPLEGDRVGSYWDAWIRASTAPNAPWTLINFGLAPDQPKANFHARVVAQEVPMPPDVALLLQNLGVTLRWRGQQGRYYAVQEADTVTGPWRVLHQRLGEPGLALTTTPQNPGVPQRFYRVRELTDPLTVQTTFSIAAGRGTLAWVGQPNAEYTIETSDEPVGGVWQLVRRVATANQIGRFAFDLPAQGQKYYRVWRNR